MWSRLMRRDKGVAGTADPSDDQAETAGAGSAAAPAPAVKRPLFGPPKKFGAWLARPMTSFHLMVSVAALLVSLGLFMVLSASGCTPTTRAAPRGRSSPVR